MKITDKVAVVTGGGSGLGAETARFLAASGAKVALLDINLENANEIAGEIGGLAIHCNVADNDSVENAVEKISTELGLPQILVNCAGIGSSERIIGRNGPMPVQRFEKVIAINLTGTFQVLRAVAEKIILARNEGRNVEGVIINTASVAAFEGQIGQTAYSASKGGIASMTLPAAREFAQFNIRVMTIAPGLIETPLLGELSDEASKSIISNIPYPKRLGAVNEFARLVGHIIENDYLNGEIIRLDGALRLQPK